MTGRVNEPSTRTTEWDVQVYGQHSYYRPVLQQPSLDVVTDVLQTGEKTYGYANRTQGDLHQTRTMPVQDERLAQITCGNRSQAMPEGPDEQVVTEVSRPRRRDPDAWLDTPEVAKQQSLSLRQDHGGCTDIKAAQPAKLETWCPCPLAPPTSLSPECNHPFKYGYVVEQPAVQRILPQTNRRSDVWQNSSSNYRSATRTWQDQPVNEPTTVRSSETVARFSDNEGMRQPAATSNINCCRKSGHLMDDGRVVENLADSDACQAIRESESSTGQQASSNCNQAAAPQRISPHGFADTVTNSSLRGCEHARDRLYRFHVVFGSRQRRRWKELRMVAER